MNLKKTYNKLMSIADALHIKVIKGKGNFKGGECVYKKENIIVLNHNKPIEESNSWVAVEGELSTSTVTSFILKISFANLATSFG